MIPSQAKDERQAGRNRILRRMLDDVTDDGHESVPCDVYVTICVLDCVSCRLPVSPCKQGLLFCRLALTQKLGKGLGTT
jgi:hypothetical protein